MASSTVDATASGAGDGRKRLAVGLVVPLAIVALAYGLWWISDRLLYIGPLDRAVFGWVVVIPLWLSAPVAAGFVWHRLTPHVRVMTAVAVGAAVSTAATILFWQAVAQPACETGPARTPMDWVVPSMLLGAVIGTGLVRSGLLAARQFRADRPWRAVALGAGAELVMVFAAILVAGAVILASPACQRPTV